MGKDIAKVKKQLKELADMLNIFQSEIIQQKVYKLLMKGNHFDELKEKKHNKSDNRDKEEKEKPGKIKPEKEKKSDYLQPVDTLEYEPIKGYLAGSPPARPKPKSAKITDKTTPKTTRLGRPKKLTPKPAVENSSRPDMVAVVSNLIENGFFNVPCSVGSVIEHSSAAEGMLFNSTGITSVLREFVKKKMLLRVKNIQNDEFEFMKA